MTTIYSPQTHINKPPTRTSPTSSTTSTKGSTTSPLEWINSCHLSTTLRANVTTQGRAHQDLLPAPTMWMTMRVPNNLILNLTSMVLMVHTATMANNKAIMNSFIKLTSNHNKMLHVG
jgi:hypothetical protein